MQPMERLAVLGGVARRSALARTAAERRTVTEDVAAGVLRDLGAGWVAAAEAPPAVIAARRLNGTVTCVSAAPFYGLQQLHRPSRVHVAVPRSRGAHAGRGRGGVVLHREGGWAPPAEEPRPVAPLTEVLARALRCRPADEALVMVDSALNQGLVTVEAIAALLIGRGGPQARATLDRYDGRSRSLIETLARLALRDAELRVDAGVRIEGVGEVDLLVEGAVVVECDGFAYHSGRQEYREDRRRDRALVAKGFVVLRFTWEEIIGDPAVVVAAVLGALPTTFAARMS